MTVVGRDAAAIRAARQAAEPDADLVELRLDAMLRPDPDAALAGRIKPAIVTCRPLREGGMFDGSEDERLGILHRAHELGAEFIDVEWDADVDPLIRARGGRGVIVSRHDFSGTPHDVRGILARLRGKGGEIAKLAVTTERPSELHALLDAANGDGSSIVIGMGAAGLATRVLADRFGSRWTYAGPAIAPGQITAARLQHEFRFRRIRRDAAVYMVIGRPVTGSLSPAMHNAGFAALGLNAAYVPLDTRDLEGLREFGGAIGLRGASVTIPYKRDVMPLLDDVAPAAAAAGAVNTIAVRDGGAARPGQAKWVGSNTDADGFLEPLRARVPTLRGLRTVILGAGGAARGVGLALRREGASVAIAARRPEAAATVAGAIGAASLDWPPPSGSWDVLVNATPVGSRGVPGTPYTGPFDGTLVYDLVYDPDPTELMAAAAAGGCTVIGGLAMLVAQAERQFEIWTGQRPPAGLFEDAVASAIKARST
ncbi:MAG TPA: type I 3-dehydroquinate dehydratase [Vicinamibacterales bacterium]|nr:type I 3-dehydroquinate dehydratase [Vicinamibacterales bacterium]